MAPIPQVIDLTRDLVRYNTVNPPGSERPCTEFIGTLLASGGFVITYDEFAPGRASLVASMGGRSDGPPPICFTGHVDTVAFGATQWEHDPLAAELDGGRVFGRGTTDMKAGLAAMLVAALRLAPRLMNSCGLVLVLTAGEEMGCKGAQHLATRPDVLGKVGALVVGEPTANVPSLGHKGVLRIEAKTHGVTAHGSMPERGINAVYKAARAVTKLEGFSMPGPAHPVMGGVTLNVGTFHGGQNINSVPDEATLGLDIRSVPGVSHAQLLEQLETLLGPDVTLRIVSNDEAVYTHETHPWVQRVYDIVTPVLGKRPEPRTMSYFTDAAALGRAYGRPPVIILGPGEPELAHQTNEYCSVRRIEEAVAIYTEIMVDWCRL